MIFAIFVETYSKMTKKILFTFSFFLIAFSIYSQKNEKLIFGKVRDSSKVVKNANVINLRSNQGTFTNDNGEFKIPAALGDTLRISSVQYRTGYIVVNKFSLDKKKIEIYLKTTTEILDGFEMKRNRLLGILGIDGKSVPKSVQDSLLGVTMDFSNVVWGSWDVNDVTNTKVKPPVVNTDPNSKFVGVGASASIPFRASEKYWALIRELKFKGSFPRKLFIDLGAKFFLVDLNIPPERYYHFLEYCNPLGIEDKYKEGEKLEVIQILREQGLSYLDIINSEEE